MKIPSEKELDRIRRDYPVGTIIELIEMSDKFAPPKGTLGEIIGVDDLGDILVRWQTGSSLKVILSEDHIRKVNGVVTVCYGIRDYWRSRKEAAAYFLEGIAARQSLPHRSLPTQILKTCRRSQESSEKRERLATPNTAAESTSTSERTDTTQRR